MLKITMISQCEWSIVRISCCGMSGDSHCKYILKNIVWINFRWLFCLFIIEKKNLHYSLPRWEISRFQSKDDFLAADGIKINHVIIIIYFFIF